MSDLLIIAGAAAVLLLLTKKGGSISATFSAAGAASGGPLVSGGYDISTAAQPGSPADATTPVTLPGTVAPPPIPPPPPSTVGGAAGTVGTGGRPLGAFRVGVAPPYNTSVRGVAATIARARIPYRDPSVRPNNAAKRAAAALSRRVPIVVA